MPSKRNLRQANANAQREQEIADLITAVKEHKKFKQLACYSIQALDKAIDPEKSRNTYRENVQLAISLDAAAVVCDILERHKGHEQVLMVCTECLIKLATDKTNAAVIASNNAVPFLLQSISSNPDLPEEVLHMAMTLLNNLCSHQKVGAMVLNEETLAQCLKVLETNSDTTVLSSVINVIEKMSKNAELAVMLNESCVPVLLKAIDKICKLDMLDQAAEDCVLNATKCFQRLLKTSSNTPTQAGDNVAEQRLKELGGIDTYLNAMEAFRENERVTRVVSKLISKMMGGNIAELMNTLQSAGLSEQAQERVLSLISSMSMDSSSMDEIMKSGGVGSMIGAMESKMSRRALEETARTVARLASSPKNIPELVSSGALDQICKVLCNDQQTADNPEVVASMVMALNRICAVAPDAVAKVVDAGVLPHLCTAVEKSSSDGAHIHTGLVRAALEFFGRLKAEELGKPREKVDVAGMVMAVVPALDQAVEADDNETARVCISALQAMQDEVTGLPDVVRPLVIEAGCAEQALRALASAASDDEGAEGVGAAAAAAAAASKTSSELSVAALSFLSGVASSEDGLAKLQEHDAFGVVVEAVGNGINDAKLRAAAVELIQKISTDAIISEFCGVLVDYVARFQRGEIDESDAEETAAIPKLALALATLAMVPGNIPKLQAAGGVAPMVVLLGAIAKMRTCPSQEELMATLASCLNEILSSTNHEVIEKGALFDNLLLVVNAVAVLKGHSKKANACAAAMKVLRTGIAKCPAAYALPIQESGGVDAIATQIRLHPADMPDLLNNALHIYTAIVKFELRGVVAASSAVAPGELPGARRGSLSGDAKTALATAGGAVGAAKKATDIIQRSGRQLIIALEQLADTQDPVARAALLPALELLEACAQSDEGRPITSKLGAVKCVLAVLDAQASQPEIVAQCSRTLQAIVTANDVAKVVQRLQAKLDEPGTGLRAAPNDDATIRAVSDDVKKLGLLMMCGDFSALIQENGGVQTIVDIVTVVEGAGSTGGDSAARDDLVRNCITAFGRAAGAKSHHISLKDAGGIVKEVVRAMTEDPNAEVFKSVAALAKSDTSLCKALIDAGAIESLVPLLADLDDSATLNASFEALAAFCSTSGGVDRVVAAGGLEFVIDHLREEIDGASTDQLAKAVNLLQSITTNGSSKVGGVNIPTILVEAGVLDLVNDSLAQIISAGSGDVEIATGLQDLLTSMLTSAKDMEPGASGVVSQGVLSSGIVQHVDALMASDQTYMSNVECVMATNQMLAALVNGGLAEGLHEIHADAMLLRAMNANATDVELARCCAQTVGAIDADAHGGGGGSKATVLTVVEQTEGALAALEAASALRLSTSRRSSAVTTGGDDAAALEASAAVSKALVELTSGMQLLANLVLLEESVDQTLADQLAKLTESSLASLAGLPAGHDRAKDDATAAALTLLGRLANLDHVTMDTDAATAATAGFVEDEYVSDALLASAISCIAGIASSSKGVESIARRGMVAHVQRKVHQKGTVKDTETKGTTAEMAAAACMETIRTQAVSSAAVLVKAEGGAESIAAILGGIDSHRVLGTTLDQIVAADGGLQVLLDVLCEMGPPEFGGHRMAVEAIVMQLLAARDGGAKLLVTTPAQTAAIVAASKLRPYVAEHEMKLEGEVDRHGRVTEAVKTHVDAAIVLLESALESDEGCLVVATTPTVLEAVVACCSSLNPAVANSCVGSVAILVGKNQPAINKRLVECGAGPAVINTLKLSEDPESPFEGSTQFYESAMYAVSSIISTIGAEESGLTRDAMRVVYDLSQSVTKEESPYTTELCTSVLQSLTDAFSGGTGALLEGKLNDLKGLPESRLAWQAVKAEDGATYYYNKDTNETTWEEPEGHGLLLADLGALGDLVDAMGGDMKEIDPAAFTNLVPLVTSHARDEDAMNAICKVLSAAAKTKQAASVLANMENIGDIVAAMQYNLADDDFILHSTEILTQLSEFNQFKVALSNVEYITVLNQTCVQHMANEALVVRCLGTLGNLAWNHPENAMACINVGVPETLRLSLTTHLRSQTAANAAIFLLEHMLEGINDEEEEEEVVDAQKLEICRAVNEPLLKAIGFFSSSEDFFVKAVRCMGSLSLSDDCIVLMVESGATRLTVFGMKEHAERPEHVASAIELISNFGAIEDDELDEQMTAILIEECGLDAILDAMKYYDTSVPILLIAFEALYNIGNDGDAADKLVELGVVQQAFTTIQNFDYERKLVAQVMKFLSVLTYNEAAVEVIGSEHLLPIVFQAMRTRVENEEFMLDALMAVANTVPDPRCQAIADEDDALKQILELLTLYDNSVDVTMQVILTCIRLATNEEISVKVAAEGMPYFMRATAKLGMEDIDLLSLLFELLFHLAFIKENINIMVQHGCIKTLLAIMDVEEYQEDSALMMKAVGMMDNVVSADEEFASIVKDKGGKQLLRAVADTHPDDVEMRNAVQSTLLSMEAKLQSKAQDGSKTGRAELFRRLGEGAVNIKGDRNMKVGNDENREPVEDPLGEFRDYLSAGQVCKLWKGKGAYTNMILFVGEKWDAAIFKSTVKGDRQGERCTFRSMDKLEDGHGRNHLKKNAFGPPTCKDDADRCLRVLNRPRAGENAKDLLCLSFGSAEEKEHVKRALARVIQTTKHWSHRLVPEPSGK